MPRRRPASSSDAAGDPRLGGLTERALHALVPPQIHERGERYYERGAVIEIAWRGDVLHADVEGSEIDPYHVVVRARGDRLTATCDCPYAEEWGEWCKHVVATLLVVLRDGDTIPQRPTLAELLAPMDRAALAELVEAMVDAAPGLYDAIVDAAARYGGAAGERRPRA
jgi:uncharacterized Zn finger protein